MTDTNGGNSVVPALDFAVAYLSPSRLSFTAISQPTPFLFRGNDLRALPG